MMFRALVEEDRGLATGGAEAIERVVFIAAGVVIARVVAVLLWRTYRA